MTLKILLIEDDAIEVMKFHRTVSKLGIDFEIEEANNGEEALEYLANRDKLPDIILLDLNMPRINGIEFLSKIKEDEVLKYIPAIVITTSINQNDLLSCYRIGIAGYVVKPLKFEEYQARIEAVLNYWRLNELVKV